MILQLETSTKVCSVALSQNGKLMAYRTHIDEQYTHAEKLHVLVQEVMDETGTAFPDLSAVAVSKGPGSYTGLRIGVSSAKGWCYGMQIPLIGISTLEALAHGFIQEHQPFSGVLCPMIDARRMEVYTAMFDVQGKQLTEVEALIIDANSYHDALEKGPVHCFGDGAPKITEALAHSELYITDFLPDARWMTTLAENAIHEKQFEDVAYFQPFYLKSFQATKPRKLL